MLEKVFIENFLSIVNEQELKISNKITTLIGGNAAGKTTILKAINKINGEKIEEKEKNINHELDITKISAKFRLTSKILNNLNQNYLKKVPDAFILFPTDKDIYYYLTLDEDGSLKFNIKDEEENNISLIELSLSNIRDWFEKELKEVHNTDISSKIMEYLLDIHSIKEKIYGLGTEEKKHNW